MEDYKIIGVIGDGSFGTVMKASNIKTGEIVAIKKMKKKFNSWEECMSLRELKSLTKLKNHQNIIKLKEALRVKDELFFIFEYMEQNVYQLYTKMRESGKTFTENQIRTIIHDTTEGLAYMHKHGFFHRDMKPENLLIHQGVTKIADFGLAREIRSRPPFTDYVATRWYRSPEILLKAPNYNSPVDIFALGCIMAELYLGAPIFKGNSELEQMYKICSVLGTPTQTTWSEGCRLAAQIGFSFPQCTAVNLATLIPNACDDAIQLLTEMLRFDPQKRPNASQVLQHPYFANFVPTTKGLISFGLDTGVTTGSRKIGIYGSADEQHIKRSFGKDNDYVSSTKHAHTEEDELEILDDLVLEGIKTTKDSSTKDFGTKKIEKTLNDWDSKPYQEDNHDALLAEIEEYVNSDLAKQESGQFNGNRGSFNSNYSSNYQSKPALTSTLSSGNMKAPIGMGTKNPGPLDNLYPKGDIFDKSWNTGLSSYDLLQKNTPTYGKTTQFGQGPQGDMYKFSGSSPHSHWNGGAGNNISNRGAQIMNTFVSYSNKPMGSNNLGSNMTTTTGMKSKTDLNSGMGYGIVDDGPDGFSKYGF